MPTAENAILYYEAGQTLTSFTALSDAGAHTVFNSAATFWSRRSGYTPTIRPNGLITGGLITPASSETSDYVDVAALTAYLAGVATEVAAATDNDCNRADQTYFILSFASDGYTNAAVGDIGKTVVGTTTSDSGTLLAYNNTTRQWLIEEDADTDDFDDSDEGITITTGTGAGTLNAVGARPSHKINSVTVNNSGAVAVVEGFEGLALSTTRGAIGGPPYIPTTSIEIGQVKYDAAAVAAVASTEIYQVVNTHQERWDFPVWDENPINVSSQVAGYAGIEFSSALPQIHSDDSGVTTAGKLVYAQYYAPSWAEVPKSENFVPPENTHSVSSTQVYGTTIGSNSSSLGQGSFTFYSNDGITDALLKLVDETLMFKFYPDRLKSPYVVCQGKMGITSSYPAGDNISHACTISPDKKSERIAS